MGHISPSGEQSTSSEIKELSALNALAPGPGQAISKTGQFTFDNISVGSSTQLQMEIPVGLVNGVNLTYTLQNNPVYIEVSGQQMVSQVQDPTNYGYSVTGSGPYTVSFLTAPASTQTPHSWHY